MSCSNWLNFVSVKVEDTIRGRSLLYSEANSYETGIDQRMKYQLQFYPIFAMTIPIRFMITYGFWQYSRNKLKEIGSFCDLRPTWIDISLTGDRNLLTATEENWYNLAGLGQVFSFLAQQALGKL